MGGRRLDGSGIAAICLVLALLTGHAPAADNEGSLTSQLNALGQGEDDLPRLGITISPETTFIDGPRHRDGTINYAAALRAAAGKGVTPENNAAVGLLQTMSLDEALGWSVSNWVVQRIKEARKNGQKQFIYFDDFAAQKVIKRVGPKDGYSDALDAHLAQAKEARTAPWTRKQYPLVAEWVDKNAAVCRVVTLASRQERFHVPCDKEQDQSRHVATMKLPPLGYVRELAWLMLTRAMLRIGEGDTRQGCEDILAVHRVARLLGQSQSEVPYLVGAVIETLAASADLVVVEYPGISSADIRAHLLALQKLPAMPDNWGAISQEYRFALLDLATLYVKVIALGGAPRLDAWVDEISITLGDGGDPDWPHALPFKGIELQGDVALRIINHWYDRVSDALRPTSVAQRTVALRDVDEQFQAAYQPIDDADLARMREELAAATQAEREEIGRKASVELARRLVDFQHLDHSSNIGMHQSLLAETDLAVVALALAASKADTGQYPTDLKLLSPRYLQTAHVDRFTGKSLIYRPEGSGYVLYSVGPNLTDDNGSTEGIEAKRPKDLVIRMPSSLTTRPVD